ncbi:MAG: putative quinol monooxygenase [Pseudomonadota bacterium]
MFAVTVSFRIHPGQMGAFLPLMVTNARASLTEEPGCHQFDVCADGPPDTVFLYELYTDRAAFDAHLATPHFKNFDAATANMVADKELITYSSVRQ